MLVFIYLVLLNIFFADWLFEYKLVNRYVTWFPEIASIMLLCFICLTFAFKKRLAIRAKYLFVIAFFISGILIGFFLNKPRAFVIFSGLRIYLKYIPFFLLPSVWNFTEKDMRKILLFILILAFVQCPIVIFQRFVLFRTSLSGDGMSGTLGTSGNVSIFLLCVITFCVAFYLKDQFRFGSFVVTIVLAFIPTTLNETKVTLFIVPLCFIVPLLVGKINMAKLKKAGFLMALLSGGLLVFKVIYDYFIMRRWGYGIIKFFTKENRFKEYADNRVVPLLKAMSFALRNKVFFLFGVGGGNASGSFNSAMSGAYVYKLESLGLTRLGVITLLWEIGVYGIIVLSFWFIMIFFDALKLSFRGGFSGAVGLSMVTVTPIYASSFLYFNAFQKNVLGVLFWFIAGYVANNASRASS